MLLIVVTNIKREVDCTANVFVSKVESKDSEEKKQRRENSGNCAIARAIWLIVVPLRQSSIFDLQYMR